MRQTHPSGLLALLMLLFLNSQLRAQAQIPKDSLAGTYRFYWSSGIQFQGVTDTVDGKEHYQCIAASPREQISQTLVLDRKGRASWSESRIPVGEPVNRRGRWRMKKGRLYVTLTHDSDFRRPGIPGVSMMLIEERLDNKVIMTFIPEEHPEGMGLRRVEDQEIRLDRVSSE